MIFLVGLGSHREETLLLRWQPCALSEWPRFWTAVGWLAPVGLARNLDSGCVHAGFQPPVASEARVLGRENRVRGGLLGWRFVGGGFAPDASSGRAADRRQVSACRWSAGDSELVVLQEVRE